jgi:hypothetical protein
MPPLDVGDGQVVPPSGLASKKSWSVPDSPPEAKAEKSPSMARYALTVFESVDPAMKLPLPMLAWLVLKNVKLLLS